MDLLDRLLKHDEWTTRQLLLLCQDLAEEKLDRDLDIGHRTVRATFLHTIRNVEVWADLMAGRPVRPDQTNQPTGRTVERMIARLDQAAADLAAVARSVADRAAWDERWLDHLDNPPTEKTFGGGIAHIITHSMHHRAQLLYMLRRLGIRGLPEGDVFTWEQQAVPVRKPIAQRPAAGQHIGFPLPNWMPPPVPPREAMEGRFCRLEPLDPDRHAAALFEADAADADGRSWTYLAYGPFNDFPSYCDWMQANCRGDDPLFFSVIDLADGRPAGLVSYLRITPAAGSIEVGHIHYSPRLQRTPAATEAMYLMMKQAFESGYRRYEWKCDALNAPSRAAAQRLGLSFEGVFRQATVYKGRNRDTAWYAAIDSEWPALREAFLVWLDRSNFDENGRQRTRLSDLTRPRLRREQEKEESGK